MLNEFLRARIKTEFSAIKKDQPDFSLRSHAQKLGISPGAYSEFLSGLRQFSLKKALAIAEKLSLGMDEADLVAKLGNPSYRPIPEEMLAQVSEWYHFAILALLDVEERPISAHEISEQLTISPGITQKALESLVLLKILKKDPNGLYWSTALRYFTKEDPDHSTRTFSGNSKQVALAKEEIKRCLNRIAHIMNQPVKDQVYQVSIHLSPLLKK